MAQLAEAKPTPKAIARKIRQAQLAAARALRKNEEQAVTQTLALLKDFQKSIQDAIREVAGSQFQAAHLSRLNALVDAAIADFERRATAAVSNGATTSANLGASYWDDVQKILRPTAPNAIGISPVLSDEMLAVIRAMPTELIRGLSVDVAAKTRAALSRAMLGAQTPFEAMRQVATIVGPRGDVGAGAAAERIVRTEMGRAFNAADDLIAGRIADARPEDLPKLKKVWIATTTDDRTRPEHLRAHKQVRDMDEPFDVGGEELDYPLDPNGSPGNTVNCRCVKVVVPEDVLDETIDEFP